jgi:hypothetical protein
MKMSIINFLGRETYQKSGHFRTFLRKYIKYQDIAGHFRTFAKYQDISGQRRTVATM